MIDQRTLNIPTKKTGTQFALPHSIALFPGAFRPPHANHYKTVAMLCARQEIDEVVVIVTNRCRNLPGSSKVLDVDIALKVWAIYLKNQPKARIELAKTGAVKHALDYFKRVTPGHHLYFCVGARDLQQGDSRFNKIGYLANKYPVQASLIPGHPDVMPYRASHLRAMLLRGNESRRTFISALPDHLNSFEANKIWTICRQGIKDRRVIVEQKILDISEKCGLGEIADIRVAKPEKPDEIFRVRFNDGRAVFVKHAHDTEKAARIGNPMSLKPKYRLKAEVNAIKWLRSAGLNEVECPEIVYYDKATKTLMLSEVGCDGQTLQHDINRGEFNYRKIRKASQFLARCCASTRNLEPLWDEMEADRNHWRAMLDLRTTGIKLEPDWQHCSTDLETLNRISDEARRNRFVHLDYGPKNIFFEDERMGVIDFELSSSEGDPAYDLGIFLSHYVIAGYLNPTKQYSCRIAVKEALLAYRKVVGDYWISMQRVTGFAAAGILYNLSKNIALSQFHIKEKLSRKAANLLKNSLYSSADKEQLLLDAISQRIR